MKRCAPLALIRAGRTVETGTDVGRLAQELSGGDGVVLVDSVTTWLAAAMDETGAWDGSADAVRGPRAQRAQQDERERYEHQRHDRRAGGDEQGVGRT